MKCRIERFVESVQLSAEGRCCGRKPLFYKRPKPHMFCSRCCREFDSDGRQSQNWAYRAESGGFMTEIDGDM